MRTIRTWGFNISEADWSHRIKKSPRKHCDKCNNNYLDIPKYKGECYLCLKGIKIFSHTVALPE